MEIKKLEYLESVYRLRNFTRAAQEQYVSQSAISNSIHKLEEETGFVLIDRTSQPVLFTPEGEKFMEYVYDILFHVKKAEQGMQALHNPRQKTLTFAWTTRFSDSLLLSFYKDFNLRYPDWQLNVIDRTNTEMQRMLLAEEIEFAYFHDPQNLNLDLFRFYPIQYCEICVLMAPCCHLSEYDIVPLRLLESERLILPPPTSMLRKDLESLFEKQNLTFRHPLMMLQPGTLSRLVQENYALAFTTLDELEWGKEKNASGSLSSMLVKPITPTKGYTKGIAVKKGRNLDSEVNSAIEMIIQLSRNLRNSQ